MLTGKFGIRLGVMLLVLVPCSFLSAAEEDVYKTGNDEKSISLSIEYLYPTKEFRKINTFNLNVYHRIREFENAYLSAGLTATHATGHITQFEGKPDEGTFEAVDFDNKAIGLGPGILADYRVWRNNHLAFHLDGSGGLIFYNRDFPAGGDRYNFMIRLGPVVKYVIGSNQDIGLGYQWMHVSNGQGVGPHNPSYDAHGLSLTYSFIF